MEFKVKDDLAKAYRIMAHLRYDDHTYTHLSARSNQDYNNYYIYPFGMVFSEVYENSLLKVSLTGDVIEGQEYQYNKTGYMIHGNIYRNRCDINVIFHIHTPHIVAVSSCEKGLIPVSQWALHFYNKVTYHNYNSLVLDDSQGSSLVKDLGEYNIILLRNHGAIICGKTIQEAMFFTYHLQQACYTQCLIMAMRDEIIIPSQEICQKAVEDLLSFEQDLGKRDWQAWLRIIGSP